MTLPFGMNPDRPIEETLGTLPKRFSSILRDGFSLVSNLPQDRLHVLFREAVRSISSVHVNARSLAETLRVSSDQVSALLSAATFSVAALSFSTSTPEGFVRAIIAADISTSEQTPGLTRLFQLIIGDRARIKQAMERSSLAREILPSLTSFDSTVDLRFGFVDSRVDMTVPIAVLYFGTDDRDKDISFQLTPEHLEQVIEHLQATLRRARDVERWAERLSKPEGNG